MITEKQFLKALEIVNNYKIQVNAQFNKMDTELTINNFSLLPVNKSTLLKDADLSIRAINCLKAICDYGNVPNCKDITFDEVEIGHFEGMKLIDFQRYRNIGKKSLVEIQEYFFQAGVVL